MADAQITDEEWAVFVDIAGRLGINIGDVESRDVTFTEIESAGHALGRAVSQTTSERLCVKQAADCSRSLSLAQAAASYARWNCENGGSSQQTAPYGCMSLVDIARLAVEIFFPQRLMMGIEQRK